MSQIDRSSLEELVTQQIHSFNQMMAGFVQDDFNLIGSLMEKPEWDHDTFNSAIAAYERILDALEFQRYEISKYLYRINKEIKRVKQQLSAVQAGQVPILGMFVNPSTSTTDETD